MQKARIGGAQLRTEDRVLLVPRAADRVEALAVPLELTGDHVEDAGQDLVLEELDRLTCRQERAGTQRVVGPEVPVWPLGSFEIRVEVSLDDSDAVCTHAGGRLRALGRGR